jgi:natural product biosynthesis luciferase-like monooxygenase protein
VKSSSFRLKQFGLEPLGHVYSFVEILRYRAVEDGSTLAYAFLGDEAEEKSTMSYEELDRKARAVAAMLQRTCRPGDRALLVCPPGLEYIAAFFGCLYAGVIAVPVYPPRPNQGLTRLRAIALDCGARAGVSQRETLDKARPLIERTPPLSELEWLAIDAIGSGVENDWRPVEINGSALCFLQYTSGSTGIPKGVMISHENLVQNSLALADAFEYDRTSHCVSWLPIYHDMGLIGGVLQPLFGGFPCTLLSPVSFLQRPARWLQAISEYRATISGGPNFAYDLCVQKISNDEKAALDLSSWSVAFNGSEPVRKRTLEAFALAFAASGFRREALYPCYGLAEATLFVAGGSAGTRTSTKAVGKQDLKTNRIVSADDGREAAYLVSSGRARADHTVSIVDPQSRRLSAAGQVGEIWVSGPSVAKGYWDRIAETAESFEARIQGSEEGPFLRTGDLGCLMDGELLITGRLKDVVIIRGLNHYPHDIEATVEASSPGLRRGCGAAFSVDILGEEQLVIVQEVATGGESDNARTIGLIQEAVSANHDLRASAIVLVKSGTLPKTSSGKNQRYAVREDFLNGRLKIISEWRASMSLESTGENGHSDNLPADRAGIDRWLVRRIANQLRIPESQIDLSDPINRYGIDSISAIQLAHTIEAGLGTSLPATRLLQGITTRQIAEEALLQGPRVAASAREPVSGVRASEAEHALSFGQRALWYMHQVAPERPIYNIAAALRITNRFHPGALERAIRVTIDRHPSLRTVFRVVDGEPLQLASHQNEKCYLVEEDDSSGPAEFEEKLVEEAYRPFDLENGPLFRCRLYRRRSQGDVLLVCAHHIICDFWSLGIIARDLGLVYSAEVLNVQARLEPLGLSYANFVDYEARLIDSPEGSELWEYWRDRLQGDLAVLNLPTNRPRGALQSYEVKAHTFRISEDLTAGLKSLSRDNNVTLYTSLLASLQLLLFRYSSQEDIVVGSPAASRDRQEFGGLVGYFVNPLVMRGDLSRNPSGESLLARTHECVLGALGHKALPFSLLVERLQVVRDTSRPPVFQVMFLFHKSQIEEGVGLAALAVGEAGAAVRLGELQAESLALPRRWSQFDLTLVVGEGGDRLGASIEFNSELFDLDTISRFADHLVNLLTSIVADPCCRISDLNLLSTCERIQLLDEWNNTRCAYPEDACLHESIERQAVMMPEAVAIAQGSEQVTYGQLNERANQLGRYLLGMGAGQERPVGICVRRSPDMLVGLLGIIKSGAAYVPIDPSYPLERIRQIILGGQISLLVTENDVAEVVVSEEMSVVRIDDEWPKISWMSGDNLESRTGPDNLAYLIFTSGSTGKPKGVMVSHRSVSNFFQGMNQSVACEKWDRLLAVTSISFDISILELFWTLSRGARVILMADKPTAGSARRRRFTPRQPINLSLFYFASNDSEQSTDKYRLLVEGARHADRNGMEAVWTPERHFHAFGGLFPNPSVTSAALAALTERVHIRAGSVVLPLHDPIRVAEEWSLVDNLSKGRVGIAFASGWHADDFAFFPERYGQRKDAMFSAIETVKKLWQGESIAVRGGAGNEVHVQIFPKPIQKNLPIWITAAGAPETFARAGKIGANVLTHLLGQTVDEVAKNIKLYREAFAAEGRNPSDGRVTMMLHTFVGNDREAVKDIVRKPFSDYLRSSVGLVANMVKSLNLPLDLERMSKVDMDDLIAFAFDRYFETSALFGDRETCLGMLDRMGEIGVNEVACLVDFGVEAELALAAMEDLKELQDARTKVRKEEMSQPAAEYTGIHRPTLMQCTPSMMRVLMLDAEAMNGLKSLRTLLLGGEALPGLVAREVQEHLSCRMLNMYGPTETTVWSATGEVVTSGDTVPIGGPISNTEIHIVDKDLGLVPAGVFGEVCIAGDGLARGYFCAPEATAAKFVPDSFGPRAGARLYKTGDLASRRVDGIINFLGRVDQQVKIRGYRVELEEVSTTLSQHAGLREAVVVAHERQPNDTILVAYVTVLSDPGPLPAELREFLRQRLPEQMVPSSFITLGHMPLTPNGKINRKALPPPDGTSAVQRLQPVLPRNNVERTVAEVWARVLKTDDFGIHDNFFDLGGHSLLMAQVHSILRVQFNSALPLIKLLEHPTISALASYLTSGEADARCDDEKDRAAKQREYLARRRRAKVGN